MTVAIEAGTGARLLPRPRDPHPRHTITEHNAYLACDADLRAKHQIRRDLAARIIITYPKGESCSRTTKTNG